MNSKDLLLNKETKSRITTEIKYVIIILIGISAIWVGLRFATGVNNPFYMVASESMVPKLNVGDFLIVKHANVGDSSFNSLNVGDIIVFKSPGVTEGGQHETIVHRVAEIRTNFQGDRVIRTKGDANPGSIRFIDYPIKEENYIGKVIYIIPKVGLITKAISPPVNYILIAIILVMLYFVLKRKKVETNEEVKKRGENNSNNGEG